MINQLVTYKTIDKRSDDVTKINLGNYGICWHIQKEKDEKFSLAKNQPVSANWQEDISFVCSSDSIINPSKIGLKCASFDPSQF